jgi:hypothetical protein
VNLFIGQLGHFFALLSFIASLSRIHISDSALRRVVEQQSWKKIARASYHRIPRCFDFSQILYIIIYNHFHTGMRKAIPSAASK